MDASQLRLHAVPLARRPRRLVARHLQLLLELGFVLVGAGQRDLLGTPLLLELGDPRDRGLPARLQVGGLRFELLQAGLQRVTRARQRRLGALAVPALRLERFRDADGVGANLLDLGLERLLVGLGLRLDGLQFRRQLLRLRVGSGLRAGRGVGDPRALLLGRLGAHHRLGLRLGLGRQLAAQIVELLLELLPLAAQLACLVAVARVELADPRLELGGPGFGGAMTLFDLVLLGVVLGGGGARALQLLEHLLHPAALVLGFVRQPGRLAAHLLEGLLERPCQEDLLEHAHLNGSGRVQRFLPGGKNTPTEALCP